MQIIVLGMHRSGTSAVTRLINMMGAYLCPENQLMATHQGNPKGFWERLDVVALNDRILAASASAWNRPADFSLERIDEPTRTAFSQEAQRIVHAMDAHRPWVLKDPRLCLTFPLWRPLLELPVCVHVVRDPVQVARSLAARDKLSVSHSVDLWEKHNVSALRAAQGLPQCWVLHDDLLRDPVGTTERLYNALCTCGVGGLRLPQAQEITTFIDPQLYHQQSDPTLTRATLSHTQTDLYTALTEGRAAELALDDWPLAVTEARLREHERLLTLKQREHTLQRELQHAHSQCATLQTQIQTQAQAQTEQLTEAQQQLAASRQQQQTQQAELARLRHTASEAVMQHSQLVQQVLNLRHQHTAQTHQYKAAISQYETQLSSASERERTLTTDLAHSQQALAHSQQTLARQDTELQALHTLLARIQSQQQDADIAALMGYLDQFDQVIDSLLHSLTWKVGLALADSYRKISFARRPPLAHDHLQALLRDLRVWKQAYWARLQQSQPSPQK